jgi:CRP-like cAMP-binding protein
MTATPASVRPPQRARVHAFVPAHAPVPSPAREERTAPPGELSAAARAALAGVGRERRIGKGGYFSLAGGSAMELGLVQEGVLRLFYTATDGRELNKHFFSEGAWLLSNLTPGCPALASVQALTPCRVWALPWREVEPLMHDFPELLWWFNQALLKTLAAKQRREISVLNQRALVRYAHFRAESGDLESRIPLHHVASYLGMTPTQLSRVRRQLPP